MNDVLFLYFDVRDVQESLINLIPEIDAVLKKHGWEYTGLDNIYRPINGTDPDDTYDKAIRAIKEADWLKEYRPFFKIGTGISTCGLEQIIIRGEEPLDEVKFRRYREYYEKTNQYAHGIIVDENNVLMDGYMTYLIAQNEERHPDIFLVLRRQRFRKVVAGKYIDGGEQWHDWYYDQGPAVVPGDQITVPEEDGKKQMVVEKIFYVAGQYACEKYKAIGELSSDN